MCTRCESLSLCFKDKCVQDFVLIIAYKRQLSHSTGMDKYNAK